MEKKLGKATRDAYGLALVELGKENNDIVVLDADLSKSTKSVEFQKVFPERFFNVGIQEANLVGVASGLAACGKIPFVSSFASFLVDKGFDQMRMALAYSDLHVKVVGSHGGISVGEDGASQMSIEDVALATVLPGFTVLIPSDEISTKALMPQIAKVEAPVYMRTCRPKAPIVHSPETKFQLGKGVKLREGNDVTIVAIGLLVYEALEAADQLKAAGISATVIDMHTVKPLDTELLKAESKKTGHMVVCEEHQIWGGLGSAIATYLSQVAPCKMGYVAIKDTFAESGTSDELLVKYQLTAPAIVKEVKKVLGK